MCGKCRVITSAVLHMKNQSQIQDLGFQICIFLVRSQNTKDILCCRQFFLGIMNIQALSSYIVVVGLISVNRQKRKYADQIQALAKYIRKRNIIRIIIIGVKGQHTSGQPITPDDYKRCCFHSQKRVGDIGFLSNIIENHDEPRGVSHYIPEGEVSVYSKKMLAVMYFMLKGLPFIYQGQEIGMENMKFSSIDQIDDIRPLMNTMWR